MKAPLKPKSLPALLDAYAGSLPKILKMGIGPTVAGEYLHWDQLRHREPPPGLNHEEWWLGIKLARTPHFREIPLKDASGKPFRYSMPDGVLRILHEIDSKAGGRIELPEQITNRETRDRYVVKSIMEEAITSSQLEGASTTRQAAVAMLRSGRKPKDTSERMILNNYRAIKNIREMTKQPLVPETVLKLHKVLTEETLEDPAAAGRLQLPDELRVHVADNATQVIVHAPPPAEQLPHRLEMMCGFANEPDDGQSFMHPIIRSILLHFWLAYDHPFVDGNGRTARTLFYWAMLSRNYWLFDYVSISRILKDAPAKYAKSYLFTETDDNDATYFIIYQLQVLLRAIEDLYKYLERKTVEVESVEKHLKSVSAFNHRQIALLSHASRHPGAEYSIASHQESNNVAYATARADLLELEEKSLLIKRISGRKKQLFVVPDDFQERLQKIA